MPGCRIESELEGGCTVIRLAGVLDRASAHELRERLDTEPGGVFVLDFSLVREFADLGVLALAHGLAGAERRLHVRGLGQHQLRMLRYFGVDVEPSSAEGAPLS